MFLCIFTSTGREKHLKNHSLPLAWAFLVCFHTIWDTFLLKALWLYSWLAWNKTLLWAFLHNLSIFEFLLSYVLYTTCEENTAAKVQENPSLHTLLLTQTDVDQVSLFIKKEAEPLLPFLIPSWLLVYAQNWIQPLPWEPNDTPHFRELLGEGQHGAVTRQYKYKNISRPGNISEFQEYMVFCRAGLSAQWKCIPVIAERKFYREQQDKE